MQPAWLFGDCAAGGYRPVPDAQLLRAGYSIQILIQQVVAAHAAIEVFMSKQCSHTYDREERNQYRHVSLLLYRHAE
ncbi:MAG: hypothetical protein ABI119_03080 [Gemmatimonadaceae bacterium]